MSPLCQTCGKWHDETFACPGRPVEPVGVRPCQNEIEQPDGSAVWCTGTLTFHPGDQQARCSTCGGWEGVSAPRRHDPGDAQCALHDPSAFYTAVVHRCSTCRGESSEQADRASDLTLARFDCQVHRVHRPSIERRAGLFTVERHHIHPLGYGGTDEPDNVVYVCPTGHTAIHELLREEIRGTANWEVRRRYGSRERAYAMMGFKRIRAAGRLPEVRRALGLPEE